MLNCVILNWVITRFHCITFPDDKWRNNYVIITSAWLPYKEGVWTGKVDMHPAVVFGPVSLVAILEWLSLYPIIDVKQRDTLEDQVPIFINPCVLIFFKKKCLNIFSFSIISQCWDGTCSWNPSTRRIRSWASYVANTTTADDLSEDVTEPSTTSVLSNSPWIFWFQHQDVQLDTQFPDDLKWVDNFDWVPFFNAHVAIRVLNW